MGDNSTALDIKKETLPVEAVTKIDARDVGTPDDWVPRHEKMVRLTGRHPFNVEAPLPELWKRGFLTPASLHYVRNHGAVPKINWSEHRLTVDGMVGAPKTFTMDDLLAIPARELPVTLVCAGNRRKEENLVKQTIGFNWGAAGVSTSVWKGVLLREVLLKCGVKTPAEGAHHVCFLGSEVMPKGRYGTSITWHTAMDPSCDVLLAYEQNGEKLNPDHGYPLRLVIPGYIGGRMIKWLSEITVTPIESSNHFHYMDNRVLPEFVDAERATAEGWWYKPDYIINQLNINSAIAQPGHQELLPLTGKGQTYTVAGYCYSGGGRKVIRVEISTDGGETWSLTTITKRETPTEYGKYWCWCFWEHEIDVQELWQKKGAELLCRGWDDAMNRQAPEIVWNVMGMMNNSYFRCKVHRTYHPTSGLPALRFQHPTLAGPGNFGGWFEEKVLGPAAEGAAPLIESNQAPKTAAAAPKALDPKKWVSFPLIEREDINHNTRRYRFGLPTALHDLGLPVGQHIFIKGSVEGKPVMRAYTPLGHGPGYVDFVIKAYFPLEPRFPNGGILTMHMETLAIGDTLQFKGPLGEYTFHCDADAKPAAGQMPTFSKGGPDVPYKSLGLIAGGSGITPCLQVASAILAADLDVHIKLLYANQTPEDVLCQPELDALALNPRFTAWYTVDRAPEGWPYSTGFISEAMLGEHLPPPGEHSYIFMCGPPPMLDRACKPNLAKLGHAESNIHCF